MTYKHAKDSPETRAFLDELVEVYKRHGMSLSHEDGQGAFIVDDYEELNVEWLREAFDERGRQ